MLVFYPRIHVPHISDNSSFTVPSLRRGYVNDDDLIDDDDPDEDYRSLQSSSGSDENIANIFVLLYTCKTLIYILPKNTGKKEKYYDKFYTDIKILITSV